MIIKSAETDKHNYRPISLLSVLGKLMESTCGVVNYYHACHGQGLGNPHQWAHKKGHSSELLLVKITDDWRRALDMKYVVSVIFVDFRKAFDAIDSPLHFAPITSESWCSWGFMVLDMGLSLWKNTSNND